MLYVLDATLRNYCWKIQSWINLNGNRKTLLTIMNRSILIYNTWGAKIMHWKKKSIKIFNIGDAKIMHRATYISGTYHKTLTKRVHWLKVYFFSLCNFFANGMHIVWIPSLMIWIINWITTIRNRWQSHNHIP